MPRTCWQRPALRMPHQMDWDPAGRVGNRFNQHQEINREQQIPDCGCYRDARVRGGDGCVDGSGRTSGGSYLHGHSLKRGASGVEVSLEMRVAANLNGRGVLDRLRHHRGR